MLTVLLALVATSARAEGPRGLSFGAAVGGGVLSQNSCAQDTCTQRSFGRISAPNLRIGYRFSQRLALELHISGGVHTDNGDQRAFDALLASVKWWPYKRWWLSLGTGIGEELPPAFSGSGPVYMGAGTMLATGLEVYSRSSLVVDIHARATTGRLGIDPTATRENLALDGLIGLTWYPYASQ